MLSNRQGYCCGIYKLYMCIHNNVYILYCTICKYCVYIYIYVVCHTYTIYTNVMTNLIHFLELKRFKIRIRPGSTKRTHTSTLCDRFLFAWLNVRGKFQLYLTVLLQCFLQIQCIDQSQTVDKEWHQKMSEKTPFLGWFPSKVAPSTILAQKQQFYSDRWPVTSVSLRLREKWKCATKNHQISNMLCWLIKSSTRG